MVAYHFAEQHLYVCKTKLDAYKAIVKDTNTLGGVEQMKTEKHRMSIISAPTSGINHSFVSAYVEAEVEIHVETSTFNKWSF